MPAYEDTLALLATEDYRPVISMRVYNVITRRSHCRIANCSKGPKLFITSTMIVLAC